MHAMCTTLTDLGSEIRNWSWVMGHGSWVMGYGSGVMGHGSWVGLVAEPASPEPDVCPALPALVVKSMESHLCA